jgi:hypothetical protein
MKENEVPQDKGKFTDLYYVLDENGQYTTQKSSGWQPKSIALDNAMQQVSERTQMAKDRVLKGISSPIEYYMELHKMDIPILASYVGIWSWRVKRHLKPKVFRKLSDQLLLKYAEVFEISLEELKHIKDEN